MALNLGVPVLIISILLYQRGSMLGRLLLTGALGYFLTLCVSMALRATDHRLFLLYLLCQSLHVYPGFLISLKNFKNKGMHIVKHHGERFH